MTALRRSPRVLRDAARNGCSWVTGNSEKSVQEPAEIPGRGIDGVTTAEEPEPTAVLVLDLPIVAGSAALAIGRPPLSGDAFGSVRLIRCRLRRQMNCAGGWSGSIARASTGCGGFSSRVGRGRAGGQAALVGGLSGPTWRTL